MMDPAWLSQGIHFQRFATNSGFLLYPPMRLWSTRTSWWGQTQLAESCLLSLIGAISCLRNGKAIFVPIIIIILSPVPFSRDKASWRPQGRDKQFRLERNGARRTNKNSTSNQQMLWKPPSRKYLQHDTEIYEVHFFASFTEKVHQKGGGGRRRTG